MQSQPLNDLAEMGPTVPSPDSGPSIDPGAKRRLIIATAAATIAACVWIVTVALTVRHGFDTTDEGFYILSYRWWNTNTRTFIGSQYFYGPVFQLLGHDVVALRLFRLVTVVSVHALFGWSFMLWLRIRRTAAPASRWWEAAGTAAIVASGGMAYSWVPLSPGYNDIELLGALLAASIVLRMAADSDRGTQTPAWVPAALGPIAVTMVLAKWTGILTVGLAGIAMLIIVAPGGMRRIARTVGLALAGTAVFAAMVHVLLFPLDTAVSQILATNRLIGATSYTPAALLTMYARSTASMALAIATQHAPLLIVAGLAPFIAKRWFAFVGGVCWGLSCWRIVSSDETLGGAANVRQFSESVLLVLSVAAIVGVTTVLRRHFSARGTSSPWPVHGRGWAAFALVTVLPAAQGFGTNNPLLYIAINAFAAWAAIMIAIATGLETAGPVARMVASTAVVSAVMLSATIPTHTAWEHPYRSVARNRATTTAAGVTPLGSIKLDPETAARYSQLNRLVQPYLDPPGRAVMAFDEMSGIVFLLNGRTIGEGWYANGDPLRTAVGVRAECHNGHGKWDPRPPILIFNRPVSDIEIAVLRSCGLTFASDYTAISPAGGLAGLTVYVPTAEVLVR